MGVGHKFSRTLRAPTAADRPDGASTTGRSALLTKLMLVRGRWALHRRHSFLHHHHHHRRYCRAYSLALFVAVYFQLAVSAAHYVIVLTRQASTLLSGRRSEIGSIHDLAKHRLRAQWGFRTFPESLSHPATSKILLRPLTTHDCLTLPLAAPEGLQHGWLLIMSLR